MKTLPDRMRWYAMHRGDAFMSKLLHKEELAVFMHAGWTIGDRPFATRREAQAHLADWKANGAVPRQRSEEDQLQSSRNSVKFRAYA